jgi:hypothetical protein
MARCISRRAGFEAGRGLFSCDVEPRWLFIVERLARLRNAESRTTNRHSQLEKVDQRSWLGRYADPGDPGAPCWGGSVRREEDTLS